MPEDRFSFVHRLTAEAAHGALLGSNRRMLHSAVADAIAPQIQRGSASELALRLQLLDHLEYSQRWGEAHTCACDVIELWASAGVSADYPAMFVRAEAAWQQTSAGSSDSAHLLLARAAVAELSAEYDEAQRLSACALELGREAGDAAVQTRALLHLVAILKERGEQDEADVALAEALRVCDPADFHRHAQIQLDLASGLLLRGRLDEAGQRLLALLEENRKQQNLRGEVGVLMELSRHSLLCDEWQQSLDYTLQALEQVRQLGNRRIEGWLLGNLSNRLSSAGRTAEAVEKQQQALSIMQEVGDRATYALFLGNLGVLLAQLGDFEGERRCYEEALSVHRRLGARHPQATMLSNLCCLHLRDGAPQLAETLGQESVELFESIGDQLWLSWALSNLAAAQLACGRLAAAETSFERAANWLASSASYARQAEVCLDWADARLKQPTMASPANPSTAELLAQAEAAISTLDEELAAPLREQLEQLLRR